MYCSAHNPHNRHNRTRFASLSGTRKALLPFVGLVILALADQAQAQTTARIIVPPAVPSDTQANVPPEPPPRFTVSGPNKVSNTAPAVQSSDASWAFRLGQRPVQSNI